MAPATYKPNGRSHIVLIRLEDGPASLGDICQALAERGRAKKPKKVGFLLDRMLRDSFVDVDADLETYALTSQARWALDTLDTGEPVHTGGRVWARAA